MDEQVRLRAEDIGVITDGMFGAFPKDMLIYHPTNSVVPTESMDKEELWGCIPIGETNYMSFSISNVTQLIKDGEDDPIWREGDLVEKEKNRFGWHRGKITIVLSPDAEDGLADKLRLFGFEDVTTEQSREDYIPKAVGL